MNHLRTFVAFALCSLGALQVAHAAVSSPPPADLSDIKAKMNAAQTGDPEQKPGAMVYREHCAQCHEGQAPKAPVKVFLNMMSPEAIYDALSLGIMRPMAVKLSDEQMHHVAEYLSGSPVGMPRTPVAATCSGDAANFDRAKVPTIQGWGQTPDNDHFVAADIAKLTVADVPKLKLKWAVAFPNTVRMRSRPTFAYGALYTGSQDGTVYALDARTGCIR